MTTYQRIDNWTWLPPSPLRGLETPLVESLDGYIRRQLWAIQVHWKELTTQLIGEDRALEISGCSGRHPPQRLLQPTIQLLEVITSLDAACGQSQLLHGTFWIVQQNLDMAAGNNCRRWCPQCLLEWERRTSWEPLAWRVSLVRTCPIHGCRLESFCPQCGLPQSKYYGYDQIFICRSCGGKLSSQPVYIQLSDVDAWVQQQILLLLLLCATEDQDQILPGAIYSYAQGLSASHTNDRHAAFLHRLTKSAAQRHNQRFDLVYALNLAAINGNNLTDILISPVECSSKTVLDLTEGYEWVKIHFESIESRINEISRVLSKLLQSPELAYLPPRSVFLRSLHVGSKEMLRAERELCDRYDRHRNALSLPCARYHSDRAFRFIMSEISRNGVLVQGRARTDHLAPFVAYETNVPLEVACAVVFTAKYVRKLLMHRGQVFRFSDA